MAQSANQKHSLPRRLFRWCRISVLLVVLALLSLLLWSNFGHIPAFITAAVKKELRRTHVALDFKRLHLSGFRRVIAEDLRIGEIATNSPLRIEAVQAELLFDYGNLKSHWLSVGAL